MRLNRRGHLAAPTGFLLAVGLLIDPLGLAYPAHAQNVDTTPPTFVSATTNRDGVEVIITFSEDITVVPLVSTLADRHSVSQGEIFKDLMTVAVDGRDNVLISSSFTDPVLTVKLEGPNVKSGQEVKVEYNNIFAGEPGGVLTDSVGNAGELFDLQSVTNASVDASLYRTGSRRK